MLDLATISKPDLADILSKTRGYKKYAIKNAIDDIFDAIKTAIENGDRVAIRGFGAFEVKGRKGHAAVHPETQEPIFVEGYNTVRFKPGTEMAGNIKRMQLPMGE